MRDLVSLPKALLHVHLESTIRPATLAALAGSYGVPVPAPGPFAGFGPFAEHNAAVRDCLRSPVDFTRVAREFCEDSARDGVGYAEVTFTAAAHGARLGMAQMPLVAVLDGLRAGAVEHGIEVRVLLDHSRRRPVEWARSAVRMAAAYRDSGVVGFGVAGDETAPLAPYVSVLAEATETGVHLMHHAGETAGPASVWEAVRLGRAERIGHGFRVLEDPSLVAWLRDRQLPLEVCPSSNVALGLVSSIAHHPLPRLREAGLAVSLNTDIPAVTGRALSDEYETARTTFGCSDSELAELAHAAVDASFAPVDTTVRMHTGIDCWLAAQPGETSGAAPVLPVARR